MSMINSVLNKANNTLFSFGKEQKSQSLQGSFLQIMNEKKEEPKAVKVTEDSEDQEKSVEFATKVCYTTEEMFRTFQLNLAAEGSAGHEEIDLTRIDLYYAKHPNEIGMRNQYYNGQWYSWAELAQLWLKESEDLFDPNSKVNKSSPNFTAYYS